MQCTRNTRWPARVQNDCFAQSREGATRREPTAHHVGIRPLAIVSAVDRKRSFDGSLRLATLTRLHIR